MSSNQSRDKGVIGMTAFQDRMNEVLSKNPDAYASKEALYANDYAAEWGKLTDEQKEQRIEEMKRLRKDIEGYGKKAHAGRPTVAAIVAAVVLIIGAKNRGALSGVFAELLTGKNALTAAAIAIVAFVLSIRAPKLVNKNPKGFPTYIPLLGHTYKLPEVNDSLNCFVLKLDREIGFKSWELALMDAPAAVCVHDAVDRRYVLKDNWRNYLKNVDVPGALNFLEWFGELMGRGIFSTDKKEWQDHRKVASNMFSVNGLRNQMEHVFKSHTEKLIKLLAPLANTGKVMDLQAIFQAFTFDTICEIAFGVSPNALDYAVKGERLPFLVAFDQGQGLSTMRFFDVRSFWEFKKWVGFGSEEELYNNLQVVNNYIYNIIHERRHSADFATKEDLLSLYIQYARKSGQSFMEEDAYLRDIILNFMIAGRDTTSCTLTNWFKLIGTSANGQQVKKRLVDECDQKIPSGSEVNWETVRALTFGDAVFNETIRMYPPVSTDVRIAEHDDVLPSSGFVIKRGMRIVIPNISIGRNPELWSNPDSYNPDRWVQYDEKGEIKQIRRPDEYVFPVFWAGARLCLGKDMARFEAKLVAVALHKHFNFEVLPHEEKFLNGPVIFYTKGVPVKITTV